MLRFIAIAASSPDMRAALMTSSISRNLAETVPQMCRTKALQWIVRYERLERLTLPSHTFIRDAVRLEICRVERQQIPAPFRFQVGDVRPAADRGYRALGGHALARDLPLAACANVGGQETRSRKTASEAPQPPGSADEQTAATTGLERGATLA